MEARDAVLIEHRDFPIEHSLTRSNRMRDHGQFRVLTFAAQPAARLQTHIFVVDKRDGADTIPLHFEEPVITRGQLLGERGFHGIDGLRHRGCARAFHAGDVEGLLPARRRLFGTRRSCGLGTALRRAIAVPDAIRGSGRFALGFPRGKVAGNLFLCASGEDAVRLGLYIPAGRGELIALLDNEPVVPFAPPFHVYQGEIAVQLFSVQAELQVTARNLLIARHTAEQLERAAIPQHHAACTVIAGRNIAFESAVIERMIFHVRSQVFDARIERRPFRHGPGFQNTIDFQAKVVVEASSIVALDAEEGFGSVRAFLFFRRRLWRGFEPAFGAVLFKSHKSFFRLYLHVKDFCSIVRTKALWRVR